jgi:hypothetical protein
VGNRNIIAELGAGEMFAEAFLCGVAGVLPVSVIAACDCKIMFADFQRVIMQYGSAWVFHRLLIRNIVGILPRKNIILQGKISNSNFGTPIFWHDFCREHALKASHIVDFKNA